MVEEINVSCACECHALPPTTTLRGRMKLKMQLTQLQVVAVREDNGAWRWRKKTFPTRLRLTRRWWLSDFGHRLRPSLFGLSPEFASKSCCVVVTRLRSLPYLRGQKMEGIGGVNGFHEDRGGNEHKSDQARRFIRVNLGIVNQQSTEAIRELYESVETTVSGGLHDDVVRRESAAADRHDIHIPNTQRKDPYRDNDKSHRKMFEQTGLLCCHVFVILKDCQEIPMKFLARRWMKTPSITQYTRSGDLSICGGDEAAITLNNLWSDFHIRIGLKTREC
ncbi:hypothetical protein DH2020_000741 [Rehmannia glutinosa]|uniref:Protein FAR1-RELATED SEQUENCE n=1 Tax=Rehmannia glutinosa TaxID=99300 RepID=A0ABR0XXI4_REHGL